MNELKAEFTGNESVSIAICGKLLFLAVNSSYSHTMLSYGYIRSAVERKQDCYDWVYNEYTLKDDKDKICRDILKACPDIILSTVYLFNREFLLEIFYTVKKVSPGIRIFLGGPEFLGHNGQFLRENYFIDAVIRGDESSLHKLLDVYKEPSFWHKIPGLCVILGKDYHDYGTAAYRAEENSLISSPYYEELFNIRKPFMQLETTRGCRGKCSFCTSAVTKYREVMTLEEVGVQLKILRCAGYKEIRVVDRTFNDNDQRAVSMLTLFLNEFTDMRFHLEINPAFLSAALVEVIGKFPYGMLHIEVGIQTLDREVSVSVNRFGCVESSLLGLKVLCGLSNIDIHTDLIAGLPGQTLESIYNDIHIIIEIMPMELQLELLKVLNGTPILEELESEVFSYLDRAPYTVIRTHSMSYFELLKVKRLSKIIDGYYNIRVLKSIFRYLCMNYNLFLNDFTEFYSERNENNAKLHLSERFKLLKEFIGRYNDSKADDLLKFSWLAAGMQVKEYGIKSISGSSRAETRIIWEKAVISGSKRYYRVLFDWNVGDIWLNSNFNELCGKREYIFRLAYGNHPASIGEITISEE